MRKLHLFITFLSFCLTAYSQTKDLEQMVESYIVIGDYNKAIETSQQLVEIYIKTAPQKAACQQFKESQIYIKKQDIPNAVNSYKKALVLMDTYGNDSKDFAEITTVNDLLNLYISKNMYDSACDFVKENQQRIDQFDYIINVSNRNGFEQMIKIKKSLYNIYFVLNYYYDAAEYALDAVDYISLYEGTISEDEMIWHNCAINSILKGAELDGYPKDILNYAEENLNEAQMKWDEFPNKDTNTNYFIYLFLYANMLNDKGEKETARIYYNKVLTYSKHIKDYDLELTAIFQMATTYEGEPAIELYKELLNNYEEKRDTISMAHVCHFISQEYWISLENNEQGELYANRALTLLTMSNVKNAQTCTILENLAQLYYRLGLDSRAVDTYREAFQIKVSQRLAFTPVELLTYYEYVVDYRRFWLLKFPENNKNVLEETESLCNNIIKGDQDNPALVNRARYLLAKLYTYFQQFDAAEKQYKELLQVQEELHGKNSFNYITTLQELAYCYNLKGDVKAARDLEIECDKYYPKLGECYNILTKSITLKDSIMIEEYLPKTYDFQLNELRTDLSFLGSWQREDLLRNGYGFFEMINPAFLYPQNESFAQYAYNAAIISKGLLLSTERNIGSSIRMVSDSILMAKHKEVTQIEEQIQQSKDSTEFMSLNHQLEFKEKELLSLLKEKGCFTRDLDLTWSDVQKELGENDIAIEFVTKDSIVTVPTGDNSTAYYGALLIRKNWDAPKVVRLSQMTETDSLIREIITTFDDEIDFSKDEWSEISSRLYTKIWEPIIQYIKPGDRILYSPINMLSIMPWEACVIHDREYMNELYDMVRLSTTKYICNSTASHNIDQAVLYGGLIYDSTSTATPPKDASPSKRTGWQYLSDTADEVKNIAEIFKENNIATTIYSKKEGTEESFKSLSGNNIPLLHIATHGFYFNEQESMTYDFMNDINAPFKRGMDTSVLLRSGLMLSNGQKAWLEGHTSLNEEDGILLASEISLLDLHNVDLVTLSACQTGLGEIRSDGVYGLQRAFKKAGVNSMLMTLWTVESESAQILMTQFYKNLLSGQSKRQALLSAQKYLREYNNGYYNKPRYWAAFILLDGLD